MKWIKRFFILALVAFLVMQFVRPTKNQDEGYKSVEPFLTETRPTAAVSTILETACFDCHTNHTVYPWYAEVAPISYWLDDHVENGKKHLNFSAWGDYSTKRKDHKLEELVEMVEKKEMPLDSYTWVHGDAVLTEQQIIELVNWATVARMQYTTALEAM